MAGLAVRLQLATHAIAHATQCHGVQQLTVWATPFSRPLFLQLGFNVAEVRPEAFQGILFDRYRLQRL